MVTRWVAWGLFALFLALSAAGVALLAQVPGEALERSDDSFVLSLTFVCVLVVFGAVGALVASRMPRNPIGWLFLGLALIEGVYELAYGYAWYSLTVAAPDVWPLTDHAAWVADWTSPLSPVLLMLVLVLFPTGRPPSPRWNPVVWSAGVLAAFVLADYALEPGPLDEFPAVANPVADELPRWLGSVPSDPVVFAAILLGVASLIVRFRGSAGVERQQLKWFAYAAGVMAAFFVLGSLVGALIDDSGTESTAAGFAFAAVISGLPITVGIAILRHRLYDIDVVIRRTLVYGSLTATLAAGYLGCVLLAQLIIGAQSDLAIAGSTLAMAALFRPARARIQAAVDRRFYRRRYDATQTLEAFGARLREQLDLEAVAGDLRGVVGETLRPAHVSVWLRSGR
jgi:hypothetical protein